MAEIGASDAIDRLFCQFCDQFPKYRYYKSARMLVHKPFDKWQLCANLYEALPALANAKRLIERWGGLRIDCGGDLGFTLRFGPGAGRSLNNVEYSHCKSSRKAIIIGGVRHNIEAATYSVITSERTAYYDSHFKEIISFTGGPGMFSEYLFKARVLSNGMLLYNDKIITTDCSHLNIYSTRYYSEICGSGEYLYDGHIKVIVEGYIINVHAGEYIDNNTRKALDFQYSYNRHRGLEYDIFKHFGIYIGVRSNSQGSGIVHEYEELKPLAAPPKPINTKPAARADYFED